MGSPAGGAAKGGAKGSTQASNAALQDDEDIMARRRILFRQWKQKRKPAHLINYQNSPPEPKR